MSQKRTIAIAGVVILAGLALIERATNSVQVVPANVVSIKSIVPDKGPDQWIVTFELSDRNTYTADPLTVRPTYSLGDPACVRMHTRSWAKTKYQITADTSCWDGAVTPLRAPD
jgi:hypothetical protein